jgi:hypothetical protein
VGHFGHCRRAGGRSLLRARRLHWSAAIERLEARNLLSVNVLTWHNDLTRQGLNSNEVALTPANVNSTSFGKLFSYPVEGQVYAQPLYVSNLAIPGQGTHNVAFVATEHNDVYAFDADSNSGANGGVLWHVNLGPSAATPSPFFAYSSRYGPYHDINPQVGITSTPVIDLASGTIYIDAFTNDVPGQNAFSHHIWALDIATGAQKTSPILVAATVPGTSAGSVGGVLTFTASQQLQRSALTLFNGILYVAYTGYADTNPYHGWVLGFNPTTLQLVSAFNTTPTADSDVNAGEGGIWQAGNGLSSDGSNLYVMIANGDFNASPTSSDWGDSFLRLTPTNPATLNTNGYGLTAIDYFTPFNEQQLADADQDVGSGGTLILPDQTGAHPHELLGSGKGGWIYVVDRDNMGQFKTGTPNVNNNNTTDGVVQEVSLANHATLSSPAYFNSTIYYHANNDVLKAFSVSGGLLSAAPIASGTLAYGGGPGGGATPSISSNGLANGIVWDLQYSSSNEVLHAYNATPSGTALTELYNSHQNAARDEMGPGVKFTLPTIADGKVFVGADGVFNIFGQLVTPTQPPSAPTNFAASTPVANQILLTWTDTATTETGFKIERSTDGVNFSPLVTVSANAVSYADTSATPGATYYYRIRSANTIGDSANVGPVSAAAVGVSIPVNLYRFDEGTGTAIADSGSVSPANNGTLVGNTLPQWAPGHIGSGALSFSGNNVFPSTTPQSAVQVNNDLGIILGKTSSLSAWIKTTQVGSNTVYLAPAIAGVERSGSTADDRWGYLDASGHIGIGVGNSGVVSTSVINDGNWHHVAFTRNASNGQVQVYVDGTFQTGATFATGTLDAVFRLIGAQSDVASDGTTFASASYFNGQLDDIRIFNQVLSPAEVAALGQIPAMPTNFTASALSGSLVQLNWTNVSSFAQNIEIDRKIGSGGSYSQLAVVTPNTTQYNDLGLDAGTQYFYKIRAIDSAGASPFTAEFSVTPPRPTILGRFVFYNHSNWDGQNGSSNVADGLALATDKQALLPGQTATFANYTSYSKGLNGIMIDVANFDAVPMPSDYILKVGNNSDPSTWQPAPTPSYVTGYLGAGVGGSTRLEIVFEDNDVQNEWVQVTLLANSNTKLAANDVFYFGNSIGDSGDSATDADVNIGDALAARGHSDPGAVTITNVWDYNRDKVVDSLDTAVAQQNMRVGTAALQLITAPSGGGGSLAADGAAASGAPSVVVTDDASPASGNSTSPIVGGSLLGSGNAKSVQNVAKDLDLKKLNPATRLIMQEIERKRTLGAHAKSNNQTDFWEMLATQMESRWLKPWTR